MAAGGDGAIGREADSGCPVRDGTHRSCGTRGIVSPARGCGGGRGRGRAKARVGAPSPPGSVCAAAECGRGRRGRDGPAGITLATRPRPRSRGYRGVRGRGMRCRFSPDGPAPARSRGMRGTSCTGTGVAAGGEGAIGFNPVSGCHCQGLNRTSLATTGASGLRPSATPVCVVAGRARASAGEPSPPGSAAAGGARGRRGGMRDRGRARCAAAQRAHLAQRAQAVHAGEEAGPVSGLPRGMQARPRPRHGLARSGVAGAGRPPRRRFPRPRPRASASRHAVPLLRARMRSAAVQMATPVAPGDGRGSRRQRCIRVRRRFAGELSGLKPASFAQA